MNNEAKTPEIGGIKQAPTARDAGTIDTPELQWFLGELLSAQEADLKEGVSFNYDQTRAKLVAHIGQHVAAARKEGRAEADDEYAALLPGVQYMDQPDGGSPTVLEQVKRMAADAAKWCEHEAKLRSTAGVGELKCNTCGVDRLKEGCPTTPNHCGMVGIPHSVAATAPVSAASSPEKVFAIWAQGVIEIPEQGVTWGAVFLGKQEGASLLDACQRRAKRNAEFAKFFDEKTMTYWGCKLFDNQEDAERASPKPPVSAAEDSDLRQTQAETAGGQELPTTEELEALYEQHAGHPADFGAAVLERWGGWQTGLLGHGGSLAMRQPQGDDNEMVKALRSARDLLANTDGLSKNNIDNLAGEEAAKIDALLAKQCGKAPS